MSQFPDIRMEIESIITEGDLVAARILSTGTDLGAVDGGPHRPATRSPRAKATGSGSQTANWLSTGQPATTSRRCSKSA